MFQNSNDNNNSHGPKNRLVKNVLNALQKEYVLVDKTHIRSWRILPFFFLVVGVVGGIVLVANKSGRFEPAGAQASPWDLSGNNIFNTNTGGKVGIGTAAPEAKLHIGRDTTANSTRMRIDGAGVGGTGQTLLSLGGFGDFAIDAPGVAAGRFVVKESGNVGIGTTGPLTKLHVAGTGGSQEISLEALDAPGRRWSWQVDPTGTMQIIDRTGAVNRMTIDTSGNVGIGRTSPLSNIGNGSLKNSLDVQGWILARSNGSNTWGDTATRIGVQSSGGTQWWMSANANNTFAIHQGGVGDRLTIDTSGNTAVANNLTVSGQNVCRQDGTNCPGGTGVWTTSGANISNTNSGNVGIGTTNATEKLAVAGVVQSAIGGFKFPDGTIQTTAASGNSANNGWTAEKGLVRLTNSNDIVAIGDVLNPITGKNKFGGPLGNFMVDGQNILGNTVVIQAASSPFLYFFGGDQQKLLINPPFVLGQLSFTSNIGIGAFPPEGKLHIAGDEKKAGQDRAQIRFEDFGSKQTWTLQTFGTGSIEGGGKFGINQVGMGNRFLIDTSGNVGIGTAAPRAKLDVAGAILASGIVTATPANTTQMSYETTLGASRIIAIGPNTTTSGKLHFTVANTLGGGQSNMVLDNKGNLGIGIMQPETKLHVKGGTTLEGGLRVLGESNFASTVIISPPGLVTFSEMYMFDGPLRFRTSSEREGRARFLLRASPASVIFHGQDSNFFEFMRVDNSGSKTVNFPTGNVAITSPGKGIILRATDGPKCFRVTVNNVGTLSSTPASCP